MRVENRIRLLLFALVVTIISSIVWTYYPFRKNIGVMQLNKAGPFFYIEGTIGEKNYNLYIDLGSIFAMSILEDQLEAVQEKTNVGKYDWSDVNNNTYVSNLYEVEKITFEKFHINFPRIKSQPMDFYGNKGTVPKPNNKLEDLDFSSDHLSSIEINKIHGSIGSTSFRTGKFWLFDFPNQSLSYIKDLDQAISDKDVAIGEYVSSDILSEEGLIAISVEVEGVERKLIIDTCAEISVLNKECFKSEPDKDFLSGEIKVSGHSFSNQTFLLLDDLHITYVNQGRDHKSDGILGIDFLKKHRIIFDFEKNKIYIR